MKAETLENIHASASSRGPSTSHRQTSASSRKTARPAGGEKPALSLPNPLDTKPLREALAGFATGITVVTACGPDGEWVGLTVNSFNSVSLNPPLVLWSLSLASPNLEVVRRATHYAVNVLAHDQQDLSQCFASRAIDKFAGLSCRVGLGGVPLLPDCRAWFECANYAQHPGGDHIILVGEVERFAHQPTRDPLVYFGGAYRQLDSRD